MLTTSFGQSGFFGGFGDGFGAAKKKAAPKKTVVKKASAKVSSATAVAASKAAVKNLQAALATLGKVTGSAQLKAVKVDGAIGPKTVAAVNWAFTNHIGSGQAPAQYRTGKLTQTQVLSDIENLTGLINTEVKRRGSATPAASTAAKAQLVQEIRTAPVPVTKEIAKRLQQALANLGQVTGSATLKAVKADGAIGAKTVAAVNWAFTNHIGSGQAPAQFRTGKLTLDTVKGQAGELSKLIEAEVVRRKGTTPTPAQITTADAKAAAAIKVSKAAGKDLQNALVNLGKVTGSSPLKSVKVDGAIGPATVTAVNWAFTKHIGSGQAPAQFRTGKLTLTDVKANVTELIKLIYAETRRRGGTAAIPTTTTVPVKTVKGKTLQVKYKGDDKYQVTDEQTGQVYDTKEPTNEVAPKTPATPTAEAEEDIAAEEPPKQVKTIAPKKTTPAQEPDDISPMQPPPTMVTPESVGGENFFSQYKWPLLGGIAVLGLGAALLMRRRSSGGGYAPAAEQYRPTARTRRAA